MDTDPVLVCLRVYDEMRAAAAEGRTITCTELGERVGLPQSSPECRIGLCRLMDVINEHMHQQGHPMLSAVVVTREQGKPMLGFFDQARTLGRFSGGDHAAFFQEELRRVYECWSRPDLG